MMEIHENKDGLPSIKTSHLWLKPLRVTDITVEYERWINDPGVTQFLEIRFEKQTRPRMENYLKDKLRNHAISKHYGVFDREGTRLVGTVTAPKINSHHQTADVSFVIGHEDAQRKRYATEAVHAMSYYLIHECGLRRLWAGYYDGHVGSAGVLAANGYKPEARLRDHYTDVHGRRVDGILVGLLAHEFVPLTEWLGLLPPLRVGEREHQ